jgi:aspartyl-tRNA(Asn)/glutamyl-tRNA(Gln) amidotransferase subunit A
MASTAGSVATSWECLTGQRIPKIDVSALRLGKPDSYFFDDLSPDVSTLISLALDKLQAAGARIHEIEIPALHDTDALYTSIARPEVLATLGTDRFVEIRPQLNPDVAARIATGLGASAEQYLLSQRRRESLRRRELYAVRGNE